MAKMLDVLESFLNLHAHTYMRLDGSTKPEQRQILMQVCFCCMCVCLCVCLCELYPFIPFISPIGHTAGVEEYFLCRLFELAM
jgi:hypothetical protein